MSNVGQYSRSFSSQIRSANESRASNDYWRILLTDHDFIGSSQSIKRFV